MPDTFNLYDAKTQLSALVERAAQGEEIIIAKAGKPVAKLVPIAQPAARPRRPSGRLQFHGPIPDDFDEWLPPEIREGFGVEE